LQISISECPVCVSDAIAPLDLRETYFVSNLGERLTIEFGICNRCGFTFQLNPLSAADFEKYYEDNSQLRSAALNVVEEFVHSRQAAFIDSIASLQGAKVLEIGSSTGKFLDFLKQIYGARTYFDERNLESRAHLRNVGGHTAVEELGAKPDVDVLVLRHVVEHVPQPAGWLASLKKHLAPSAHVFIEVPDWSFVDDETNTFAFEHVNHFAQHTLSHLLFRAGYIVVKQEMSITKGYAVSGGDRVLRVLAKPFRPQLSEGVGAAVRQHHHKRVSHVLEVVERTVKTAMGAGQRVAFYGASWGAERVFLNTAITARDVVCIFDRDKRKHDAPYYDVPVFPPEKILESNPDVLLIFTSHAAAVKRDLAALGFKGRMLSRDDFERIQTQP